jgi:hypothetical protein
MISALLWKISRNTLFDKGRLMEIIVFPISFLVIWGLLFSSNVIAENIARELLIINIIWTITGSIQTQINMVLVFDLWSRELSQIITSGVTHWTLATAHILFGLMIGLINLIVCLLAIPIFGGGLSEIKLLLICAPLYALIAIGLALTFSACIFTLGKSYSFVAWTGLQIIVMFSSPYTSVHILPQWLQYICSLSAMTSVFEFVRTGSTGDYIQALCIAVVYVVIGATSYQIGYTRRRLKQGLATL